MAETSVTVVGVKETLRELQEPSWHSCVTSGALRADVYMVRDPSGAIVLTNVPAATDTSTTERVFAETERQAEVEFGAVPDAYAWEPTSAPTRDDGRYDLLRPR